MGGFTSSEIEHLDCPICEKEYEHEDEFEEHLKTHTKEEFIKAAMEEAINNQRAGF